LHCNSKRSNDNYVDKDYVTFAVVLNGQVYSAPACTAPAAGYVGLVKNGDDIRLWDATPGDTNWPSTNWQVGPITIDDQDEVAVLYTIVNLSYEEPGKAAAEGLKIEGGIFATAAGTLATVAAGIAPSSPTVVGGFAALVVAIVAGIVGIIGAALALIGEIVGAIGGGRPNCDGAVLVPPVLTFTGAQLEEEINTGVPNPAGVSQFTANFVNSHLTQPTSDGCWTPDTDVTWSVLRDIHSQQVFGPTPPQPQPVRRMLAASQNPQDWDGTWGDGKFAQESRIVCIINSSGSGPTGTSPADRAKSYIAGLQHSLITEPMTGTLLGGPIHAVRSGGLAIAALPPRVSAVAPDTIAQVAPVSARYAADIVEHLGAVAGPIAVQVSAGNLVEIPMLSDSFTSNIYPAESSLTHKTVAVAPVAQAVVPGKTVPRAVDTSVSARTGVVGATTGIAATGEVSHAVPLSFAATLVATAQVSRELFGEFDQTGKLLGHRLRYVRIDPSGNILTDVMLAPVQNIPT
jgi:hypothetical protein